MTASRVVMALWRQSTALTDRQHGFPQTLSKHTAKLLAKVSVDNVKSNLKIKSLDSDVIFFIILHKHTVLNAGLRIKHSRKIGLAA